MYRLSPQRLSLVHRLLPHRLSLEHHTGSHLCLVYRHTDCCSCTVTLHKLPLTYSFQYRRVPSECPPSFIRPPPPIFPHRKNWYRECTPPCLSAPPPFSERPPSRYLASDAPTMHNEVPKCAWHLSGNVADYSLGLHDAHSMIVHDPVGVAVVVHQWRGSTHICKHDVPSQRYLSTNCSCSPWPPFAHRRSRHLTAHARSRTRSAN